jgi:hypothetical protein
MNDVTKTERKATGDLFENVMSDMNPSEKAPNKHPISFIVGKSAISYSLYSFSIKNVGIHKRNA